MTEEETSVDTDLSDRSHLLVWIMCAAAIALALYSLASEILGVIEYVRTGQIPLSSIEFSMVPDGTATANGLTSSDELIRELEKSGSVDDATIEQHRAIIERLENPYNEECVRRLDI